MWLPSWQSSEKERGWPHPLSSSKPADYVAILRDYKTVFWIQSVNNCICETIMAEVLVRARALVVIARNVLYLHTRGHTRLLFS